MTKHWKQTERRMAKAFNTTRTPLSGSNSKHNTNSDTLSPYFYLESKSAKRHAVWSLWDETKPKARKEGKPGAIVLHRDRSPGFIIAIHSDDLQAFIQSCIISGVYQDPTEETNASEPLPEVEDLPGMPSSPDSTQDGAVPRKLPVRRSADR